MKLILASMLVSAPSSAEAVSEVVQVPEGLWDRFVFGLQYSATGILVVFLVLFILMLVVKVFEICFYKRTLAPKVAAAPVEEPVATAASCDDDAMIAAVIAAAVDAYYENAQSSLPAQARKKYQIRSFRRI